MLMELVKANRSYRGYDHSRKVSREELLEMVEAARLCPSSVNMQPFRYFLAYDEKTADLVQKETRWARGLPQMQLPHPGKEPAAFIVICQDETLNPNLDRFMKDVGIVAQTMLLRAVEMGLGGCMIGNFSPSSLGETLGLDKKIHPLLVVAVGRPDEEIILTEIEEDGKTNYYRDEEDRHYVPKRKLEDIVLEMD